jgi:hypothetical protein
MIEKAVAAATIIASIIAVFALGIAIWSLHVARQSLDVSRNMLLIELQNLNNNTSDILAEMQSIQVSVGIHNGEDAFLSHVDAARGEERVVQISFKNISGCRMDMIAAHVILPPGLEYVSGSTMVYNRTNPKGLPNVDGIANEWTDLGGYSYFDEQGRGSGSVSFKVRVSDDESLFVPGVNSLNLVAEIGGYIDGDLAADTYTAYATVDVLYEKP